MLSRTTSGFAYSGGSGRTEAIDTETFLFRCATIVDEMETGIVNGTGGYSDKNMNSYQAAISIQIMSVLVGVTRLFEKSP